MAKNPIYTRRKTAVRSKAMLQPRTHRMSTKMARDFTGWFQIKILVKQLSRFFVTLSSFGTLANDQWQCSLFHVVTHHPFMDFFER